VKPINVDDYRRLAQRRLPRMVFDYLDGGAGDEIGVSSNREAFSKLRFLPKRLQDVGTIDLRGELLGAGTTAPVFIAPLGGAQWLWPHGDIALARAAARTGVPFVLSSISHDRIEDVVASAPELVWFQLYVVDRSTARRIVAHVWECGVTVLMLTVDMPRAAKRERDLRNGFDLMRPWRTFSRSALSHPSWTFAAMRSGSLRITSVGADGSASAQQALLRRDMDPTLDWSFLKELRDNWPGKLVVKGVLCPTDVARCASCGVDAVLLSNHGGRQSDVLPSPMTLLAEAAQSVSIPILIDGGFRRGWDVLKAVALGGTAVGLGRAVAYGLAAGGESGAVDVLRLLIDEMRDTLTQIGCRSLKMLDASRLIAN